MSSPISVLAAPAASVRSPALERAVQYAFAVGLVAVAHVIGTAAWRSLGPSTFAVFLSAVVITSLYGGYGPGLVATLLSSVDIAYAFIPPYDSLILNLEEVGYVVTFTAVALLTSSLQARRRSAEASLRRAHDDLDRRVRERTAELAASQDQLSQLVRDLLTIAEREQLRIGHDLHDGLGQELTGISMLGVALAEQLRGERSGAGAHAERIAALVQQAIRHTRDLARGLCPVDLEDEGLAAALGQLADRIARLPGVRCGFDHVGDPAVDAVTAIHLYRIAQEAINNALRHGHAKGLSMMLYAAGGRITLTVSDDGVGFSPGDAPAGMGLRLMRYRARTIRATLDIGPAEGGGTTVTCEISNARGASRG